MYGPEYLNIIKEICINSGITYEVFDNRCISLKFNGETQYIWSRRFPQNSASSSRLIDSKCVCATVLCAAGLPAIVHTKLYRSDTEGYIIQKETNQQICEKIMAHHGGVVIKPNDSYEGKEVFSCFSSKEIESALFNGFRRKEILAAAPYIHASAEYRIFYFDGTCPLIYKKRRPYVTGDGKSTLADLISKTSLQASDLRKNLEMSTVPQNGEVIEIGWKFNLSRGSTPEIVEDNSLTHTLLLLAKQAAKTVNARFVTVDLLECSKTKEFLILEMNAGVAMDQFILKHPHGRAIAYEIYEKAIKSLFE